MVQNPVSGRDPDVTVGIGGDASGLDSAIGTATSRLGDLKVAAGVAGGAVAALGGKLGVDAVNAAVSFEDAMTDLAKVAGEDVAAGLESDIRALSEEMPLTAEELAGLAEDAARFGVEGEENILQFTESAAKMGEATQLSTQQAGESLAKLAELTNTPVDEIENLGSSVNELSNNFGASSQEIVDASLRSAGSLSSLGASQSEIFALNTALNEVSESSERTGTRLRRLGQELLDADPETLSDPLGLTTEQFEQMRENDPVELIKLMAETMSEGGESADQLRENLSTTSRQALSGLAQNLDGIKNAVDTSTTAFEEATSLQEEFNKEMEKTTNQMQTLNSQLNNIKRTLGEDLLPPLKSAIDSASDLVEQFSQLNEATDGAAAKFGLAATVIGGAGVALAAFVGGPVTLAIGAVAALAAAFASAFRDIDGTFGGLERAAGDAIDAVRDALVGTTGDGGLTAIVADSLENAQTWLQENGTEMMAEAYQTLGAAAVDAAQDLQDILVGPRGRSGVLTVMVDQGIDFISQTAPKLVGGAFQAIGRGIRLALKDMTNPLRGRRSVIWDMLGDAARWLVLNIPRLMVAVGQAIVRSIINGTVGLFKGLVGNSVLKDQISNAGTFLIRNMDTILGDVGGAIKSAIVEGLSGLKGSITGAISSALEQAEEDVDDFIEKMKKRLDKLPGGGDGDGEGDGDGDGEGDDDETGGPGPGSDRFDTGGSSGGGLGGGENEFTGGTSPSSGTPTSEPTGPFGGVDLGIGFQSGAFIASAGFGMVHAGERVLPAAQVSDRGEASFDPSSVADGFDQAEATDQIVRELRRVRQTQRQLAEELDVSVEIRDGARFEPI